MKKYSQGGFTLIELLVVIAIIGILSSVVLASLSTARNKAKDARVQSQLGAMRAQALLYTGTGNLVNAVSPCAVAANTLFDTASNGLGNLVSPIIAQTTTRCSAQAGLPSAGNVNWAVAADVTGGTWCVDSTGVSRFSATTLNNVILNATFVCQP